MCVAACWDFRNNGRVYPGLDGPFNVENRSRNHVARALGDGPIGIGEVAG